MYSIRAWHLRALMLHGISCFGSSVVGAKITKILVVPQIFDRNMTIIFQLAGFESILSFVMVCKYS